MELIEKVAIFQNAQVFPDLHADLLVCFEHTNKQDRNDNVYYKIKLQFIQIKTNELKNS